MNNYKIIAPTMYTTLLALGAAIKTHPLIKEPIVFSPVTTSNNNPEPIYIETVRISAGLNLSNTSGLALSLYPFNSGAGPASEISTNTANRSITYSQYDLGPKNQSSQKASYSIIVQLDLLEPYIFNGNIVRVKCRFLSDSTGNQILLPFYKHFEFVEINSQDLTDTQIENIKEYRDIYYPKDPRDNLLLNGTELYVTDFIDVEINQGEAVLQQYMEVLRFVLQDIDTLYPLHITNTEVTAIDFPTSNWQRTETGLVFHTARLFWTLETFIPNSWQNVSFPPIQSFNIQS